MVEVAAVWLVGLLLEVLSDFVEVVKFLEIPQIASKLHPSLPKLLDVDEFLVQELHIDESSLGFLTGKLS